MRQLIFLGDTHCFIDDFKKQKELIDRFKPEFVLSEQLQEVSILNKKDYQDNSYLKRFNEQNKLINLCNQNDIKLIGIDFKDFGFNKRQQKIVKGEIKPTKKDIIKIHILTNKRKKHHIFIVNKYLKLSQRPIIVIIGCWHLKEKSKLRKSFKGSKIIVPVDNNNKLLIGPKEINKIRYITISN